MKAGRLEVGDLVYPSDTNPLKFNKNTKFPWKIVAISDTDLQLTLEHKTPISGKTVREKWWIGFWVIEKEQTGID